MMVRLMNRGWLAAGGGLVVLAGAVLWLVRPEDEAGAAAGKPPFVLPVTLVTVERGDLRPRTELTGDVRARQRAELAFEVDGSVEEVAVQEADTVDAGTVLARLANEDETLAVAEAQASLQLAERGLDLLLAGEREEEKRRLDAVLEATRAEEDLAASEVARGEKLLVDHVISESEQDRRRAVHRAAEKRRVAAEEEYARAIAGTRPEDLAIARARVDEARTRLAIAEHELEKTELRAPWRGSVVRRHVSAGAHVQAGTPVFELIDLEHLEIHLEVPGRLAGRLGPQTKVAVREQGRKEVAFETALDAVVPAADERARSFRAIVRLGPGDEGLEHLAPGMFVEVNLLLEPLHDVLTLPSDALLAREGSSFVVRAAPGPAGADGKPSLAAELVTVRLLAQADGRSAFEPVDGAVAAGDSIVLTGADNAFPGATLMPLGEPKESAQ